MKHILALVLAAFFCPPNFSMDFTTSQKAAEFAALNELFLANFPNGLNKKGSTQKEMDFAADALLLKHLSDDDIKSFLDHIDTETPSPYTAEIFPRVDIASTVLSLGKFPLKISLCRQHEKSIHYCVSCFDQECLSDTSCQFGVRWSQIGRAIQIGPDGRYLATILTKGEPSKSYISLFDLQKFPSKKNMGECFKGEFEISAEPGLIDCCFIAPQKMVIRVGQKLFNFFISKKFNSEKNLESPFSLPPDKISFFSNTESLVFACGTSLLVAVSSKNNLSKMLVLKQKSYGKWVYSEELEDEPKDLLRVAHQSGFYITAYRADLSDRKSFLAADTYQSCTVYDVSSKPEKYQIRLGVVSAIAISPSGKSFCAAVVTNKEPQLCVYSLLPACQPQLVSVIPLKGALVVHRLFWPEWGGGILAFAESQKAYSINLGNDIRSVIAAWRERSALHALPA